MLKPGYFQKLIKRVDLELSPVNQQFHSVEEGVNIRLFAFCISSRPHTKLHGMENQKRSIRASEHTTITMRHYCKIACHINMNSGILTS